MSEYHVIKIDICPDCQGRAADPFGPNCIRCKCSGRIQSVASFEEALSQSSAGKNFQLLLKNMNDLVAQAMANTEAMIQAAFNNKKGMH